MSRIYDHTRPIGRFAIHRCGSAFWPVIFSILCLLPSKAIGDAIVMPQAMFAETIAEYFVEDDKVRLELEIGQNDIGSFRNILPDEVFQKMGYGDAPLQDRLPLFLEQDIGILSDGVPLKGFVEKLAPAVRQQRDRITGEVIPAAEEDAVVVIGLTAVFPFEGQPERLTLLAPRDTGLASIGFVIYHLGVPVNDFRYLSSGYEVRLDWEDPWYSAFPQRSLRRQYDTPMSGFLYIEPYEVRREIIVRPHDLQRMTSLGIEGQDIIRADQQDAVKARIVEFLQTHFPVTIDGEPVEGKLDRVNFLRRTLKSSTVIDNQDVDLLSATVGIIHVYPTNGLPQEVEMEWDLFTDKMSRVAAAAIDQAGPLPTLLEPRSNVLLWKNFLKNPEIPALVDPHEPPTDLQKLMSMAWWPGLVLSLFLAVFLVRKGRNGERIPTVLVGSLVLALTLTAFLTLERNSSRMDAEKSRQLIGDLLHNVYRAFDYRGEEAVYDVLARSVSGDLLANVYLETRQGLVLANQGGAQVKVKEIEMEETRLLDDSPGQFTVEARWNVYGSVGHWGHIHQRTNAYHANITVTDIDGAWKLTSLDILQEERL